MIRKMTNRCCERKTEGDHWHRCSHQLNSSSQNLNCYKYVFHVSRVLIIPMVQRDVTVKEETDTEGAEEKKLEPTIANARP